MYERVGRAGEFVRQLSDADTGRVPLYGSNDGANVLPLSECGLSRLSADGPRRCIISCTGERVLPPGHWDELAIWLFGEEAAAPARHGRPHSAQPASAAFVEGGYYTLRRGESWGMVRCHTYKDRPAHLDMLHFDLWWRGLKRAARLRVIPLLLPRAAPDVEKHFQVDRSTQHDRGERE